MPGLPEAEPAPEKLVAAADKQYVDGTHRTTAPSRTLERLQPVLTQVGVTRVAVVTGLDVVGIPVVMVPRPNGRSLSVSQGKGVDLTAAKVSGIMEAVEAWHADGTARVVYRGTRWNGVLATPETPRKHTMYIVATRGSTLVLDANVP